MERSLVTDFLSSLSQRDLFLQGIQGEDMAGVLRLDILFFGKIMVPDTHLFDGSLLLDTTGPAGLADMCGHTPEAPTIEIRLRRRTFDSSLSEYLMDASTRRIRPQEFRYIRDEGVERRLAAQLDRGVEVPAGLPPDAILGEQMRSVGVEPDMVAALREARQAWSAAGPRLGLFGTWPRRPFQLANAMAESPLPADALTRPSGRSAHEQLIRLVSVRGDTRSAAADQVLRDTLGDGLPPPDLFVLRDWYHDCRQIAIARQHGCLLATRPSTVQYVVPAVLGRAQDVIPAESAVQPADADSVRRLVFVLGSLPAAEYRQLLAVTAPYRREWLSSRRVAFLEDLIEVALKTLRPSRPRGDRAWYQQERVILPTGSTLAGMLASGPVAAVIAGVVTVGLGAAATTLSDLLTQRGDVRSLIRWAESTGRVPGGG